MEGIQWLLLIGVIWGCTNPLIKRGSAHAARRKAGRADATAGAAARRSLWQFWADLLLDWQYTVPFLINLSGSALFFATLGKAEISTAVPVANAVTFVCTALTGILLGERVHLGRTAAGTFFVLLGIYLCVGGKPLIRA